MRPPAADSDKANIVSSENQPNGSDFAVICLCLQQYICTSCICHGDYSAACGFIIWRTSGDQAVRTLLLIRLSGWKFILGVLGWCDSFVGLPMMFFA